MGCAPGPGCERPAHVGVRHRDPTHKILLAALLQRATAMPLHEHLDTTVAKEREFHLRKA